MNTNNNVYTVIYTTVIVVVVAALLAFVSQSLKAKQDANEKADTISQMLTAAGYATKADLEKLGNTAVLAKYDEEIEDAFVINLDGDKLRELEGNDVFSPKQLKRQNYNLKGGPNKTGEPELPVFIFKNGRTVVPIYGAGLWGPIWGYLSFETDQQTIGGAYFDHESETAGLGAKIKDDPSFQAQFVGEKALFADSNVFDIVKGGAPKDAEGKSMIDNKIDAITGATMTSNGLDAAIDTWLAAYAKYFQSCGKAVISSEVELNPIFKGNPITVLVLGICSSLAVTVTLKGALVMTLSVIVVTGISSLILSLLRNTIPGRVRIIVQLVVVAMMVILVDQILKSFEATYAIDKQLSVYIGLIITNCIVMGRIEAFALGNKPWPSFLDGVANGAGYGLILLIVAFFRELLGSGTLFGIDILNRFGYVPNNLVILPPFALILLGCIVWVQRSIQKDLQEK